MGAPTRRDVLKSVVAAGAAAAGAVLSLPVTLHAAVRRPEGASATPVGAGSVLNAYIRLPATGGVVFQCPYAEMGQGIYMGIAQVLAEELDIPFEHVSVEHPPPGEPYKLISFGGPKKFRVTGGSLSMRSSYKVLRETASCARRMLIQAAAADWHVPENECMAELGVVRHAASGRHLPYSALIARAAALPVPEPVLKNADSFRYIGKPMLRLDSPSKINGSAKFGIDTHVPGMVYAAVKYSPIFGGEAVSFDKALLKKSRHLIAIEKIPGGVAVVADNFYAAKQAAAALEVTWSDSPLAEFSSAQFAQRLQGRLDERGETAESVGDAPAALHSAAKTLSAEYALPFLAHGAMEPPNCTAHVTAQHAEVWIGNQMVELVAAMVQNLTKLPPDRIAVHTPYLGGGFGRRVAFADQVIPAVMLSQKLRKPVKLIFTREEDVQHDFYRPMTAVKLRAGFDAGGVPVAWHFTAVGDGPLRKTNPLFSGKLDESVYGGLDKQPYAVPNKQVDYVYEAIPTPVGYWRSVEHSGNAFCKECFIDEMAAAAGQDEIAFRRSLLREAPRFVAVLDRLLAIAHWKGGRYQAGDGSMRAMGIALHEAFGSVAGEVAEVSIREGMTVVHRVWAVVDCGMAVNPAQIEAQFQSAIVFGLSACLFGEIVIENGAVRQSNFTDYPMLTLAAMPVVEVAIIESGAPIGGIGEAGTPLIAPAVVNALAKLTGRRIRTLPLAKQTLTLA